MAAHTIGGSLLLYGRSDGGLSGVCQPQPPDLVKALEHKCGLQISPGNARRAPFVRPTADVMACLSANTPRLVSLSPQCPLWPQHILAIADSLTQASMQKSLYFYSYMNRNFDIIT